MRNFWYWRACLHFKTSDADFPLLRKMIEDNRLVSRKTFLKYADPESLGELSKLLGYEAHPGKGLTMAGDYHVSYHKSKFGDMDVYYVRHSAIEYIFRKDLPYGR